MSPKFPPPTRGPFGLFSAKITAKYSWAQFLFIFIVVCALSAVAIMDFTIAVDNEGWISRGTLIAKRSTQYWILNENVQELGSTEDNEALWQKLLTEEQPNFSDDPTVVEEDVDSDAEAAAEGRARSLLNLPQPSRQGRQLSAARRLAENPTEMVCDYELFVENSILDESYHIAPLWKTTNGQSIFEPSVVEAICEAELNTMQVLYDNDLCVKDCVDESKCLAPYSVVYFARAQVQDYTSNLTCSDLSTAWSSVRALVEAELVTCVEDIKDTYTADGTFVYPDSCPAGFYTSLLQETYDTTQSSDVTLSIFPTAWEGSDTVETWYNLLDELDRGNAAVITGAYDNERESLGTYYTDAAVQSDMILAMGSGAITTVAILLHTQSPWITLIGLLQIILSFPLSYFFYTFVFGLNFFPFLNFIGVFVVFALGADDVFVAMDKWKNARLDYPTATTAQIASTALPDAAGAMLLTTTTTAVAFFATAICPVAPLQCFAIFVGLLIVFDYVLCCLLVFPALCIYDKANLKSAQNEKRNFCCSLRCKKPDPVDAIATPGKEVPPADSAHAAHVTMDDDENKSLIRRILLGYYYIFHKLRWVIFVVSLAGTVAAGIFAARLELPQDSEVRLLGENVEYEQAWLLRKDLLVTTLDKSIGSPQALCWGVTPADTGNYVDPRSGSKLVLDASFDPSQSQEFLLNFCDGFFEQDFASKLYPEFTCPMNDFNDWLVAESESEVQDANYVEFCNDATGLPMPEEDFHACASAWAIMTDSSQMVQRNGKIIVMFFYFVGTVRFDSPFNELRDEYNAIDTYLTEESESYPSANNVYAASIDFWWFDTNGSMLRSAYQSAGIAVAFSGLVVLLSSRSFILTIFALVTISYVLLSTTAMLVASGWTLGFLESICFAILIGISCDFVLHFCHAYAHLPGSVSREVRTKFALIRMGPSILAAAFTTIASAAIMLFTVVSFFQQFATILFFTIIQATVGSFVVFTAFADCIGPSHPTALFDKYVPCCKSSATADSSVTTPDSSEGGDVPVKTVMTDAPSQERAGSFITSNNGSTVPVPLDEDETECSC